MDARDELIPIPPVVRQRLAETMREARLLRSLLRVSVKADQARGYGQPKPGEQRAADRQLQTA